MGIKSNVPFVHVKEVWTKHPQDFYQQQCQWLLENLGGRLRKLSLRKFETELVCILLFLFETDWFRSVRVVGGEAVILERRRGQMFFVIRLQDIAHIKRYGQSKYQKNQYLRKSKQRVA